MKGKVGEAHPGTPPPQEIGLAPQASMALQTDVRLQCACFAPAAAEAAAPLWSMHWKSASAARAPPAFSGMSMAGLACT